MRGPGAGAVGILCLVALVVAVPFGASDGNGCAPGDGSPIHWSDAIQDDAGSGGDAGDLADVALGLQREGTAHGTLDHPAAGRLADRSDWFTLEVSGAGEDVMANITVQYTENIVPPHGDVQVSLWAPGATAPAAVADSARQNTVRIPDNAVPGLWRFHVTYVGLEPGGSCDDDASVPLPYLLPTEAGALLHTYHVYIGCDPVCVAA